MAQALERIFGKSNVNADLISLTSQLALMGGQVESILGATLDALQNHDISKAAIIGERKSEFAILQQGIDGACESLMIDHNLNAQELRRVIAIIKTAADLERIGQLSANISWRVQSPETMNVLPSVSGIIRLGKQVQRQVISALDTLAYESPARALQVYQSDDDIDRLHAILKNDILDLMTQGKTSISAGTHLMFIIRHFERMADHASHIAESVYYAHTAKHLQQDISDDKAISDSQQPNAINNLSHK